ANDLVSANPYARVPKHVRPKQRNKRDPRVLTVAEIDELVAAAVEKAPSYAPLVALMGYTGCRVREALAVRWIDVDPEKKLIYVRGQLSVDGTRILQPKTAASKRVNALLPKLEPFLGRKARMQSRWSADTDYVASGAKGKPKEYRNLRRAIST